MSTNTILGCGTDEIQWSILLDFATQVAAADFESSPALKEAQEEITRRQPVWLITILYRKEFQQLSLAKLMYLAQDSDCGRDKKDYVRALLGIVGRDGHRLPNPEDYNCACLLIRGAMDTIMYDMMNHESIPLARKRKCKQLFRSARRDTSNCETYGDHCGGNCNNYERPLFYCRAIASTMYEDMVLLTETVSRGGDRGNEQWEFSRHSMRRRRKPYAIDVCSVLLRPTSIIILLLVLYFVPKTGPSGDGPPAGSGAEENYALEALRGFAY
jgi:hypothetical protein